MLLTEYNGKKYLQMFQKKTWEEGLKGGGESQNRLINTVLQNGVSPEYLSEMTGSSLSEISEIPQSRDSQTDFRQTAKGKQERRL